MTRQSGSVPTVEVTIRAYERRDAAGVADVFYNYRMTKTLGGDGAVKPEP